MLEFIRSIGYFMYRFTLKRNDAVIWGWPDGEDSVLALEKSLQHRGVERVVVLVSDVDHEPPCPYGAKTVVVKKDTVRGWLSFCFSKYVFFTHRCFMTKFPPNVVSVNVWHGMPIKRIGWMLEGNEGIASRYACATSAFWKDIIRRSMRPFGETLETGLPRNDRLFSDRLSVIGKLGIPAELRLVAWLPTYRRSVVGEIREDGTEYGNLFEMPDINPAELNDFCRRNGMILIVKPHPMAIPTGPSSFSHLWIIDHAWLYRKSLSLYELLGATDFLISDISSVVVDYLLLDRPVIHAFPDIDTYRDSRGFSMEPLTDYFMGPVATSSADLYREIENLLSGDDPYREQRRRLSKLFHLHHDQKSTERLLEIVIQ
jgi:CDP-glycerol glycerophosphotransferase (TagB/SpsB family)